MICRIRNESSKTTPGSPHWRRIRNEPCVPLLHYTTDSHFIDTTDAEHQYLREDQSSYGDLTNNSPPTILSKEQTHDFQKEHVEVHPSGNISEMI